MTVDSYMYNEHTYADILKVSMNMQITETNIKQVKNTFSNIISGRSNDLLETPQSN